MDQLIDHANDYREPGPYATVPYIFYLLYSTVSCLPYFRDRSTGEESKVYTWGYFCIYCTTPYSIFVLFGPESIV